MPSSAANHDRVDREESFEAKLSQLEDIVDSLEKDLPPLEEALEAYERGVKIADACLEQLRQAELRIEEISLNSD